MRRLISIFILLLSVVCCTLQPMKVHAFDGDKHAQLLRKVLFGGSAVSNTDAFDALNDACEIAIDQHNNDGQNTLNELIGFGVPGLPEKTEEFNVGHGALHRNYTHRGWDYDYSKLETGDEAHWVDIRKRIILNTVNKVFDFGFLSGKLGYYDPQCVAFSKLIYYVHIIGDHISNTTFHPSYEEIPLVKGRGNETGIIEELILLSPILFQSSSDIETETITYRNFIDSLKSLQRDIKEVYKSKSDLYDVENYTKYNEYATRLMEILEDNVSLLIYKEKFFKKCFK